MATAPAAEGAAPKGGGSKKLIIIIAAVLALVLAGGGAALMLLKKKPADDGEDGADTTEAPAKAKAHAKSDHPPTFVPLDPFTVNLADKDVDRFAQIGVTLQVDDPHFADQIKAYMPAIRSNVLMVLSHKTAVELLTREGKEKLAKDILRESLRPMGIEPDEEDEDEAPAADGAKKKKKKKKAHVESPITQVLFSNFIVQ
ncbi:flagellar basal body-associated FliL family protein [Pelomonas aquatica]|jgi:flagellar FliL protein|uniref:Flagellar protein FliL n=1 Tax=Pelomonas aquatica TaxID=431058 RepID=A0A9X4LI10_9BURK|nr:flagellar basal body-associated FliL family protein [Pelomonas aquatica]MCY4757361.1 flagellar basal body-associated FliL family protein [Pelomonas aquatica]MDG0863915.1 flagellar basal body rod protein [Pelomonas aquatica]